MAPLPKIVTGCVPGEKVGKRLSHNTSRRLSGMGSLQMREIILYSYYVRSLGIFKNGTDASEFELRGLDDSTSRRVLYLLQPTFMCCS